MQYFFIVLSLLVGVTLHAQDDEKRFIFDEPQQGSLALIENGIPLALQVDPKDDTGVLRAVESLQKDFEKVAGKRASTVPGAASTICIGTVGQSSVIDGLLAKGLLKRQDIEGKREKFIITVVENPAEDIKSALVIAGSDKRGTIYGIYELSKQMGVSPWYFWADVPVERAPNLYIKPGVYTEGEPAVAYRGIFLNDEYPALTKWANLTFGGYNSQFYETVFELILRLKGNFLWPAMWGNAFYDDDPQNGVLANEMGIVMSTSHHEPMARAQAEWKRHGEGGAWDYSKNKKGLQEFWRKGMERAKDWETVVTIAMRGDGDEPMSEKQNTSLLEDIVADQREIIADVTGEEPAHTPQVWALYKEVQDYYDNGMRVPDDVTLLFCDDNWGNVRKLPELGVKPRKGGYGMYYHFDYVGGPRNTKWLNVSQISRVWEQLNLTYAHGVDKIWVVNVGDLKPMEYPMSFFLDMAWNPKRYNPANLTSHTRAWCAQQFGQKHAKEAARLIELYTKFNHRVTPELLDHKTYSLTNYNEFETVVKEYRTLLIDAMRLYNQLSDTYKDTFDQLVLFPINGMSNLYDMYYAKAMNDFYVSKKDLRANYWADKVKESFTRDSLLTLHFNTISGGKWKHMMDQIRIGYTSWNNPDTSMMPAVVYIDSSAREAPSNIFVEQDGYVSIEAMNFFHASNSSKVRWTEIPNLGKTESAVTTLPVTEILDKRVYLEYKIDISTIGKAKLLIWTSPTLNYNANRGLRYAVSINGGQEQIVNINGHYKGELGKWQARRIIESQTSHDFAQPGEYTIRIRPLEHGIVIQKVVMDFGGLQPSYLGPPQSAKRK
ncbi:glycosyl hydrolase 115 family protein [Sphingobacterium sp. JB170]|uniref:glycosyl hydrolase 115 family protein n=1 Tax=Sphingobacterium sp. JB170 TaxID=1434842 RepID=UPI00097E81F7|nr:glycosyl hydrolase 115 family protein [Sphingobacterium sp. JB170]SJN38222.1 hypothetical protein FM107_09560 [Sphingobacterium sp. JB170]